MSPAQVRRIADIEAQRFITDTAPLRAALSAARAALLAPALTAREKTRVRVAYLSGTGFQSFTTTAHFIIAVLESHDARAVDAYCYAFQPDDASQVRILF